MNQATFIGNLTADANKRQNTSTGKEYTTFTIAVNRKGKDNVEVTYVSCIMGGDTSKLINYLTKGKKVAVVGRVGCHGYTDKNGAVHASLDLFVNELELLGSKSDNSAHQQRDTFIQAAQPQPANEVQIFPERKEDDTDLPF